MITDAGQKHFEQIGLYFRLGQFRQDFIGHGRGQVFHQTRQGAAVGRLEVAARVERAQNLHNAVLKGGIGLQAQVIDRRLQQQHLLAPGLGSLGVLHQQVAIGNDV